jgi:hypothetical protein
MGYGFLRDTTKIKNKDNLQIIQTAHKIWFDYTRELLNQIFNTNELAEEFNRSGNVLYINRRVPPLNQEVQDLQTSLQRNLDSLNSIDARLSLFLPISAQQESPEPDIDLSIKRDEQASLQQRLRRHVKNLNHLEEEKAKGGFDLKVLNLIDDEKEVIKDIQEHIRALETEIKEREQTQEQLSTPLNPLQKAEAELVRQRDLKTLRSIFESICSSVLDRFFMEGRRGYIPDDIFFYQVGVDAFVKSSTFHIYDKDLEEKVINFSDAWASSLSFGRLFQISAIPVRYILIEKMIQSGRLKLQSFLRL